MPLQVQTTAAETDDEIVAKLKADVDIRLADAPYRAGDVIEVTDAGLIAQCHLVSPIGVVLNYRPTDKVVEAVFFGFGGAEMALPVMPSQIRARAA